MLAKPPTKLVTDGKFFRAGSDRVFLKMVTYGPFPDPQPDHMIELKRVVDTGFNAVRTYISPTRQFLDAAVEYGLWVFVGIEWASHVDFISDASVYSAAKVSLSEGLREWGSHPAVAGVFVGNEIASDMVRWMGAVKVREALEELIQIGREQCPDLLFAYANFPTTEYLEPNNSDFTAMNVYLESQKDFADYLPRLHNIAGDRPVVITEFGLDTQRNSEDLQKEVFLWYVKECLLAGMAGMAIYAWSDRWLNAGRVMDDWSFGLTRRDRSVKPALSGLTEVLRNIHQPEDGLHLERWPKFSIIVCTHNGERHIDACLSSLLNIDYPDYEVIVINDGSSDDTEKIISKYPNVRLINLQHAGLSAVRNRGAAEASGEILAYTDDDCQPDSAWLKWLAHSFIASGWDACGGPNLPPRPLNDDENGVDEAVVASAPGAPSHVLLSDKEAEHIPGCNLVVRKEVFDAINGFDPVFRVAGDDVDFCWRLTDAGYRIGFSGAAFVWHRRRTTLLRYFKQQMGYGKAEALLIRKHPQKFTRGNGAQWKGIVYTGGAMSVDAGSFIYHGSMGTAPYQQASLTMQPLRPLARGYNTPAARVKLHLAQTLQPLLRKWARWRHSLAWQKHIPKSSQHSEEVETDVPCDVCETKWWSEKMIVRESLLSSLLENGWEALDNDSDWDLVHDDHRVIIACEYHKSGTMVLTRIEIGSPLKSKVMADFPRLMIERGLTKSH